MSHYVIELRVLRVDHEDKPARPHGSPPVADKSTRTVTEIVKHVVRGDVFETTIKKAQAHLELAEDFDGIDDISKGNSRDVR